MFHFKKPAQRIRLTDEEKALLGTFHLREVLNQESVDSGGFANVKKGVYNGKAVIVKIIKHGSENAFKRIIKEVKIIKRCEHENIIELLGICTNELAIMLPFMEFSFTTHEPSDTHVSYSLRDFFKHCGPAVSAFDGPFSHLPMVVAKQLVSGIRHMHSLGKFLY